MSHTRYIQTILVSILVGTVAAAGADVAQASVSTMHHRGLRVQGSERSNHMNTSYEGSLGITDYTNHWNASYKGGHAIGVTQWDCGLTTTACSGMAQVKLRVEGTSECYYVHFEVRLGDDPLGDSPLQCGPGSTTFAKHVGSSILHRPVAQVCRKETDAPDPCGDEVTV